MYFNISFFSTILMTLLVISSSHSQSTSHLSDLASTVAFVRYEQQVAVQEIKSWNANNEGMRLESISQSKPYYSIVYNQRYTLDEISSRLHGLGNLITLRQSTPVHHRETTPNDNLYGQQWSLERIGAPVVWDQTTGGTLAASGEEIVVAILDDGFYSDNIELLPNLWVNENEIPDNGIDDDNNGYVDDYKGYNAKTNNDQHELLSHGTRVAGIIGAKGDNGEGISGLNWNIKLMLIGGASNDVNVIESYEYIKAQKELYINSNGERGANILVTNFSGGIQGKDESDIPEWCELYNELGQLGILSVGSVENRNVDYAEALDLPTRCSSDYLIMTTNTDQNDDKVFQAGFSDVWVDLGAPGEGIPSTNNFDEYKDISGTSASAPHVAGAIALLYSLNCEIFSSITSSEDLALTMKEAIMGSVVTSPIMELLTVSGGRLDIANAALKIRELCGLSNDPLSISIRTINTDYSGIEFSFSALSPKPVEVAIYDTKGKLFHKFTVESPSVYEVNTVSLPFNILEIDHSGMYILTLDNEVSHTSTKFVKQ